MKFPVKFFIIGCLLSIHGFLFAHNPMQSSLKLSIYEQSGILEVNLAQYGVEQALIKKYPDLDLKSINPTDFKELLINYLKENIAITIDDQQLKIGKGAIKLGSHQTDLRFQLERIPAHPNCVIVDAHCFQENDHQQNFFRVAYQELEVRKILTQENNFKSKFTITASEILVEDLIERSEGNTIFGGVAAISLLSLCVFLGMKIK